MKPDMTIWSCSTERVTMGLPSGNSGHKGKELHKRGLEQATVGEVTIIGQFLSSYGTAYLAGPGQKVEDSEESVNLLQMK